VSSGCADASNAAVPVSFVLVAAYWASYAVVASNPDSAGSKLVSLFPATAPFAMPGRIALGAAASDVRRMVVGEGMAPAAVGLFVGVAGALAVNRLLQSQLVGVTPYDRFTMAAAPIVLLAVALCACQVPARRAVSIDPAVALRHD